MKYSSKDYEFLGKRVAEGQYVERTTFALALVVVLLVGALLGRYVFPYNPAMLGGGEQKRAIGQQGSSSPAAANQNLANSIKQHEDQVAREPNNAEAWEHLGNLYYDSGAPEKSISAYTKSIELKPGNTSVLVDMGVMYRELKEYDKALDSFRKALAINPKHEHALFNTGVVFFFDLKQKEEALKAWRELVKINPNAKAPSGQLVSKLIQDIS